MDGVSECVGEGLSEGWLTSLVLADRFLSYGSSQCRLYFQPTLLPPVHAFTQTTPST